MKERWATMGVEVRERTGELRCEGVVCTIEDGPKLKWSRNTESACRKYCHKNVKAFPVTRSMPAFHCTEHASNVTQSYSSFPNTFVFSCYSSYMNLRGMFIARIAKNVHSVVA